MLARVAAPDRATMMDEHLLVEPVDQSVLDRKRRRGSRGSRSASTRATCPGSHGRPRARTADHHAVGAGGSERRGGVMRQPPMSPLTTTGIETLSLTARTARQSARPL